VCGRQLALRTADDGTDNGRHRAAVTELGPQVVGLAGGLGGGDAGSADVVEQLQLPVVSTAISEAFQNASTVFDINPPFADVHAPIGKFRHLYDAGVRTAAIVYLGVDQTRSEILGKQKPQMEAVGIQVVSEQELPLSTLSYDSAARAVANSGADYLLFLADATASAAMAQSMADTGYELMFAEYVTAYGDPFLDIAGPAAEGAVSWIRTLPNEEAGSNAEQSAFLEWMAQVAPDAPVDTFAADAWAGAKALVDALEALPGPITREAVLAQLRSMDAYDAGGLLGTIQLGPKLANGCMIAMIVEGGAWRRLAPDQGFLC
jgi:ABC-type branched-subunit amino acid transport system substrate-binding protein